MNLDSRIKKISDIQTCVTADISCFVRYEDFFMMNKPSLTMVKRML